ncbi:SH3 domain-containing protein [Kitasatospora sp. NPDC127067]|uniref:SH3 domain-containing protein n=1 Tax=Kitasatospora sp. NPDC127067 TaxID=3347126 RepID=UPI00365CC3BC
MRTARRKIGIIGAIALAGGFMLSAGPASAEPAQPLSEPGWCGWHPGNDSHDPGRIEGDPTNIRSGQSTMCDVVGEARAGDGAWVRCRTVNGAGEAWYYLETNGRVGWVKGGLVSMWWTPMDC